MRPVLNRLAQLRLARFITVGTLAAGMLLALTWLLVSAGLPPFAGSITAYVLTFLCAYTAQRGWTFGGAHGHARALPRYFALQAGCAVFSGTVSHVAVTRYGLSPLPMAALTTVLTSAASYVLSLVWVFPSRSGA
jgi:putative flippase GtrA